MMEMSLSEKARSFFALLTPYLIALAFLAYFIFQMTHGNRGVIESGRLKTQLEKRETYLTELTHTLDYWKNKVDLLDPESPSLAILEEESRRRLGMIKDNEVLYYLSKEELSSFLASHD